MRILLILVLFSTLQVTAQETLFLRPGTYGKDAEIFSLEPEANLNGNHLRGNAWTFDGHHGIERGLLEFDLDTIPVDAEITAAYLSLYAPDNPNTQFHSGDNSFWIQRITSPWDETSVTWNTQPTTTTINQLALPSTTSPYQDFPNLDVTILVQDALADSSIAIGFMIRLQNETTYRRLGFASGDYYNAEKHPMLEIHYTTPEPKDTLQDEDLFFQLLPNPTEDWLILKTNADTTFQFRVEIIDVLGRILMDRIFETGEPIDVRSLASALYFIRISDNVGRVRLTSSFVKAES
jgi:Secretion system C-terminal sorting domain